MKKTLKALGILVVLVLILLAAGISYIKFFLPNIETADIQIEVTPERVARGEYLANHVTLCIDCHSTRDWSKFSGPYIKGTEGGGGELFNRDLGFPGEYVSANITPTGVGTWTDGELYRAITSGIGKDGRALFPVMPYLNYGKMDKEDIYSIIAYIRTLPGKEKEIPAPETDFPMNIIINTIPKAPEHQAIPDKSDALAYGKYIANAAGCAECHTPVEQGRLIEGMTNAGGREFKLPIGLLRSPNITPDPETGIGHWTKEQFIERFKSYLPEHYTPQETGTGYNTIMPWTMYSGMNQEDLSALFDYLQSQKPIVNKVVRFEPAS